MDAIERFEQLEKQLDEMLAAFKADVFDKISSLPFKGKVISKSPLIFTMKLSDLDDKWTPDSHFPAMQAEAVRREIEPCESLRSLCRRILDILDKKHVGRDVNSRVYLTERTIGAISGSEIGAYVIKHKEEMGKCQEQEDSTRSVAQRVS